MHSLRCREDRFVQVDTVHAPQDSRPSFSPTIQFPRLDTGSLDSTPRNLFAHSAAAPSPTRPSVLTSQDIASSRTDTSRSVMPDSPAQTSDPSADALPSDSRPLTARIPSATATGSLEGATDVEAPGDASKGLRARSHPAATASGAPAGAAGAGVMAAGTQGAPVTPKMYEDSPDSSSHALAAVPTNSSSEVQARSDTSSGAFFDAQDAAAVRIPSDAVALGRGGDPEAGGDGDIPGNRTYREGDLQPVELADLPIDHRGGESADLVASAAPLSVEDGDVAGEVETAPTGAAVDADVDADLDASGSEKVEGQPRHRWSPVRVMPPEQRELSAAAAVTEAAVGDSGGGVTPASDAGGYRMADAEAAGPPAPDSAPRAAERAAAEEQTASPGAANPSVAEAAVQLPPQVSDDGGVAALGSPIAPAIDGSFAADAGARATDAMHDSAVATGDAASATASPPGDALASTPGPYADGNDVDKSDADNRPPPAQPARVLEDDVRDLVHALDAQISSTGATPDPGMWLRTRDTNPLDTAAPSGAAETEHSMSLFLRQESVGSTGFAAAAEPVATGDNGLDSPTISFTLSGDLDSAARAAAGSSVEDAHARKLGGTSSTVESDVSVFAVGGGEEEGEEVTSAQGPEVTALLPPRLLDGDYRSQDTTSLEGTTDGSCGEVAEVCLGSTRGRCHRRAGGGTSVSVDQIVRVTLSGCRAQWPLCAIFPGFHVRVALSRCSRCVPAVTAPQEMWPRWRERVMPHLRARRARSAPVAIVWAAVGRRTAQSALAAASPAHARCRLSHHHACMRNHLCDLRPLPLHVVTPHLPHVATHTNSHTSSIELHETAAGRPLGRPLGTNVPWTGPHVPWARAVHACRIRLWRPGSATCLRPRPSQRTPPPSLPQRQSPKPLAARRP